jgi:hypothetical protein
MRLIGAAVAATDSVSFGRIGDFSAPPYLIKFAATYIGETLAASREASSRAPFTKERLNLAIDVTCRS